MIDILSVAVAGRPRGKGIEMPFDPKKRMRFVAMLGEEAVASLEAGLLAQGKNLEDRGVNWKSLDACLGGACPPPATAAPAPGTAGPAAPAATPTSPASPYIAQLQPAAPASVAAAQASLKASGSPAAQYVLQLLGE